MCARRLCRRHDFIGYSRTRVRALHAQLIASDAYRICPDLCVPGVTRARRCACVWRRAFLAEAERSAAEREAEARPPALPPLCAAGCLLCAPRPRASRFLATAIIFALTQQRRNTRAAAILPMRQTLFAWPRIRPATEQRRPSAALPLTLPLRGSIPAETRQLVRQRLTDELAVRLTFLARGQFKRPGNSAAPAAKN